MKLSTKGRYGLQAILDVACHPDEQPVPISSIAARQELSEAYLEQLMAKLKKAGLIESQRGAAGGYLLARSADTISVGDVLRALEGDLEACTCPGLKRDGNCKGADSCVTKYVWEKINESIATTVDGISLARLVQEASHFSCNDTEPKGGQDQYGTGGQT